jgi:TRAP-type mannitol/chloroaromatic compound transport system permease small subunit
MSVHDELYDQVRTDDEDIIRLQKKLWLFEWFLFFLMIYMCYIAYNLYQLSWDVIELSHQATTFPQPIIFP